MIPDHVDVLIVGAGISGIGAAAQLTKDQPGTTYAVLERREAIGGTWDLFRYPGIRSDSDMHTLGYRIRPWDGDKVLAEGGAIRRYVGETADAFGVRRRIRFGHRATRYSWDSGRSLWTVDFETDSGPGQLTCGFLWNCTGYYDYDEPYAPEFAGLDSFRGEVVKPQFWPADLDYRDKQVVVVGSGATAVTLVPALAESAAQVIQLQRTPSYVLPVPLEDAMAARLRRLLPGRLASGLVRWRNILLQAGLYQAARRRPAFVRGLIRKANVASLPEGYAVDTHFAPPYDPWDQRLCIVPDGDLFRAIRRGKANVVTGQIEKFTPEGIRLSDGSELQADIVVLATGLSLLAFGGAQLVVDGDEVKLPERFAYKGLMLEGVPNFAFVVGYANASWTLKADLVSEFVVRLLRRMAREGAQVVVPVRDRPLGSKPMMELRSGYVLRAIDSFPKQGDRAPWSMPHNYLRDVLVLRHGAVGERALRFR